MRRILNGVITLSLLMLASLIVYFTTPIHTPQILYVPEGSIKKAIFHLQWENPDLNTFDGLVLRLIGAPQHGWIDLETTRLSRGDYLYRLTRAKAATRRVTLIPGETTWFFFDQLCATFGLEHAALMAALKAQSALQEGVFVPDTYRVPLGLNASEMVAWLLARSQSARSRWLTQVGADEQNLTARLIMASIIEKEAADPREMPIVASVIVNRLRRNMKLQMDGTLNYGSFSHTIVTRMRLDTDTSGFNTYKHRGLPPDPVCNVSNAALKAALYPAKSDYYYFVLGKNGRHHFSRYYSTHKAHILHATSSNN